MSNRPILLVDDEPTNLAALRQALAGEYRLVYAQSGAQALNAATKHQPLLILLDIRLPDMDGYAVCRQLKADAHTEAIPVIFVTALSEIGDEAAGFAAGAVDYIIKPVSPPIVQARVRTHLSLVRASALERSYRDAIHMLGEAGHYNDTDTGDHIWRMAAYARALADARGWERAASDLIEMAAPMHDMGKIGIPDAILCKPGPLTADEWAIMKTHSYIGHDILIRSQAPVFQMAAEIALSHHERWDGSGYPQGLSEGAIPESAQIVALADVFDALTMRRPYKEAWPLDKTVQTIVDSAGSHFDPCLVDQFVAILPKIIDIKAAWSSALPQPQP